MQWAGPPLALHGAHRVSDAELREFAGRYRARLETLAAALDAPSRQGARAGIADA
jgi:hypothetical protein